jgi:cytochrome P450
MRNKLPPSEKTEEVLFENAQMLVGAGFETTGFTLSTAHYHVLANPDVCRRLKKELTDIWPDNDATPPWTTLEDCHI